MKPDSHTCINDVIRRLTSFIHVCESGFGCQWMRGHTSLNISCTATMAARRWLDKQLDDVTRCDVCSKLYSDPRILPCSHTFCMKCLEMIFKQKQVKSCPLCRATFTVPDNDFSKLQKNLDVKKMVEARKIYEEEVNHPLNEENSSDEARGGMSPARPVDAAKQCCLQCQENDCAVCTHETPEFPSSVQQAPSDLRGQIQSDTDEITERLDKARDVLVQFREGKGKLAGHVADIQREINRKAAVWTATISSDKRTLLELIKAKEREQVNQMEAMEEKVEQHKAALETLKQYSEILLSTGTDDDMTRSANRLHSRAEVLPLSFEVSIQHRPTCNSVRLFSAACYATSMTSILSIGLALCLTATLVDCDYTHSATKSGSRHMTG